MYREGDFTEVPQEEVKAPIELEAKPKYRFMITRHAERVPSGKLSPEGIKHAEEKGQSLRGNAEVLKSYASDHKSKRAYDTIDLIAENSGIESPASQEQYVTREVSGIQYDVLMPDLYDKMLAAKTIIEEGTLNELGMSTEKDDKGKLKINIEELSEEEQQRIAPTRQKWQKVGFRKFLSDPECAHRLAMGLAHQLVHEFEIAKHYDGRRKAASNPPKKDVILNTGTHGMFTEALLMEAGVCKKEDGQEQEGITDFEGDKFGGYVQPAESIYLDVDDPSNIPDRIPVAFEGESRPKPGTIFVNFKKLQELDEDYKQWKRSLEENANEGATEK